MDLTELGPQRVLLRMLDDPTIVAGDDVHITGVGLDVGLGVRSVIIRLAWQESHGERGDKMMCLASTLM